MRGGWEMARLAVAVRVFSASAGGGGGMSMVQGASWGIGLEFVSPPPPPPPSPSPSQFHLPRIASSVPLHLRFRFDCVLMSMRRESRTGEPAAAAEQAGQYKVKDLSHADFGRLKIELAEVEIPGLMACRAEFGPSKPFAGARILGSLHMTIQTAILIKTLTALGAEVHWCSCNNFSTQDHAVAAIVRDSAAVFAWKGETLEEY